MDTRTDDFIGEIQVRSDDNEELKSVELFAHDFIVNDSTAAVEFADAETRERVMTQVETAIRRIVWHCVQPPAPVK